MLNGLLMAGLLLIAPQDDHGARVDQLVRRLISNGQRYEESLPSIACDEKVRSQVMRKGKVEREVVATGTMTVRRTESKDEPFAETNLWKMRDGRPLPEGSTQAALPYFVQGVFSNALGFGGNQVLLCNEIRLTDLPGTQQMWLDFEHKADLTHLPICTSRVPGLRRTVFVDRDSEHVTRIVRTIPDEEAFAVKEVPYSLVEYGPVTLGAETFWLPYRAETRLNGDRGRMLMEFSGCHRFTSTVTITGGTETVPAPQ